MRESRAEATERVTCAVTAWLWSLGSRVFAREVGLNHWGHLCKAWSSTWVVDLAAIVDKRTYVIEVKGTRADLRREVLDGGKWTLPFDGLTPWLAVDAHIGDVEIPRWGLLIVEGTRVRVARRPPQEADDGQLLRSTMAIAHNLCMASLPHLMGLRREEQVWKLREAGFDRPWRQWAPGGEDVVGSRPGDDGFESS